MKSYNGHRNYNAWNIALWIDNDETIYLFALECLKRPVISKAQRLSLADVLNNPRDEIVGRKPSLFIATNRFMRSYGGDKTPDGVPYTRLNVSLALAGLED